MNAEDLGPPTPEDIQQRLNINNFLRRTHDNTRASSQTKRDVMMKQKEIRKQLLTRFANMTFDDMVNDCADLLEGLRERCAKVVEHGHADADYHRKNIALVPLVAPAPSLSPFGCKCWVKAGSGWTRDLPDATAYLNASQSFCQFCGKQRGEK